MQAAVNPAVNPPLEGGTTPRPAWEDIGRVTVPAGTKRKTVIEKALADATSVADDRPGQSLMGDDRLAQPLRLRALSEESASETAAEWEQPPPRLKIG